MIKAYSLHDREVGYCQGSGFIVGLLLMQVSAIRFIGVLRFYCPAENDKTRAIKSAIKTHFTAKRV